MMCRCLAVCVLLTATSVLAAPPEKRAVIPVATPLEILWRLSRGVPIPVVVVAPGPPLTERVAIPETLHTSLKDGLSALARSLHGPPVRYRGPSTEYAASRIGGVWTIAEKQVEPPPAKRPRPANADVLAETNPASLTQWVTQSLSAKQLEQASGCGIPFADLTYDQRTLLEVAFHSPVTLSTQSITGDGHLLQSTQDGRPTRLDVKASVLRVYSVFGPVQISRGKDAPIWLSMRRLGLIPTFQTAAFNVQGPSNERVPHTESPSELPYTTATMNRKIGLSGVHHLENIVAVAARLTGFHLIVDRRWKNPTMYVGDASLPIGGVLITIAYDLDATWRRVGDTWFLTRDRSGREQRRLWEKEAGAPLRMMQYALRRRLAQPVWESNALRYLRPEPGGNPGPTPEQIGVMRAGWVAPPKANPHVLKFSDLNPDQQAAYLSAAAGRSYWDTGSETTGDRPITEELVRDCTLPTIDYVAYLEVPDTGRVDLFQSVYSYPQPNWHGSVLPPEPPPLPIPARMSIAIKTRTRALAVAPLSKADWPALIQLMKARGISTLYFPVFWDGRTLFPSRFFPQLPMSKGRMLEDLLAGAKAHGIQVIGVVNALTWRLPGGSSDHWLSRRHDLLDVDALGRSRREWLLGPSGKDSPQFGDPDDLVAIRRDTNLTADFVTSRSAEVRARLLGAVAELRRYHGLSGIALRHWTSLTGGMRFDDWAPALGYTGVARASFARRYGVDPVDIGFGVTFERNRMGQWAPSDLNNEWQLARQNADADLAIALIAEMRRGWPGNTQLFMQEGHFEGLNTQDDPAHVPPCDLQIADQDPLLKSYNPNHRALVPALGMLTIRGRSPLSRSDRLAAFAADVTRVGTAEKWYPGQTPSSVVLDFTAAPDLLFEGLGLLKSVQ